jgi:hypothetical protein
MTVGAGGAATAAVFADAPGVSRPSSEEGRPGFLSDVIVELGYVDAETVTDAVEHSRQLGKSPEALLLEIGAIGEEQLARAIAERNGLAFVDLMAFPIDQGAQRLIGSDIALRYRAAPIAFDADGALIVALADPLDALAVSDIGAITKSEVRPAVATESGIDALLATMPPSPPRRLAPEPDPSADADSGAGAQDAEWKPSQSIAFPKPEPELSVPEQPAEPRTLRPPLSPDHAPAASGEGTDATYSLAPPPPPVTEAGIAPTSEPAPAPAPEPAPAPAPAPRDDLAIAEIERLEAELAQERTQRDELERARAQEASDRELERTQREEVERAREREASDREQLAAALAQANEQLAQANEQVGGLTVRLEELERQSHAYEQQLSAVRDDLLGQVAEAGAAQERELERRRELDQRLVAAVGRAKDRGGELQRSLEQIDDAIAAARAGASEVAPVEGEPGDEFA